MTLSVVYPIDQNKSCDLCGSLEKVDRQQKEVGSNGYVCVDSFFAHGQSNLCQECKSKGWIFFWISFDGKSSYFNTKTHEFKHL